MTAGSVRDALGVREDPEFDISLPPGWSRRVPDAETKDEMLRGLKDRLMQAHRPDLYGQLRAQVEQSFADMEKNHVIAMFLPDGAAEETILPVSMNACIRRAEPGETLNQAVAALIRDHGATPLLGDKRTVRCEEERTVRLGTDTLISHSVLYLTPVPGAKRRRALQIVAGFARPVDTPADAPKLRALRSLFDACVASVRWRAPASAHEVGAGTQ